jgi:hypothetical protein
MSQYSSKARAAIGNKISKIADDKPEMSEAQRIAIAIEEARKKGLKVPKAKKAIKASRSEGDGFIMADDSAQMAGSN